MSKSYPISRMNSSYIFTPVLFLAIAFTALSGFAQSMGAPQVETESPADGAVGVALDAEVFVEFDRDVSERNLEQVEIRDADDEEVGGVSAELNDNVLTIDHDDFDYFTEYTVRIPSNTVESIDGPGNGSYSWSFTTMRGAPVIISENPEGGADGVALDTEVSAEFDQDVFEEDLDDVEIRDGEDDEIEGVSASLDGNVLTVSHPGFNPATEYTVIIPEGVVENEHEYENEEYSWSFTTTQEPVLAENESPPDGSGGVALDEQVSVGFNQNVSEGDVGQVEIEDAEGNPVTDVSADLDENVLTIDHDDFDYFTEYTVTIPEGTVVDNFGAGNEEFSWSFTTMRGAPVVISESPEDGADGVALDAEVSAEFDQEVFEEDLDDVEIRDADDDEIEGVSASLDGNVLTVSHPGFNPATEYTVVIPEGVVENEHEYENEEYSWSFTTTQEPVVAENESPSDGSEGVALDAEVSVGFNQNVSEGDLDQVEIQDAEGNPVADVSADLDENVLTIDHDDFDYFTEYTVTIPEGTVVDNMGAGNEEFIWSFTTMRGAPVIISENPEGGADGVALDAEVSAEFDQEVFEEDLDDVEIRDGDDDEIEGVSASLDDNVLTVSHPGFNPATEYTVVIPEGVVENEHEYENEEYSWSFTTIFSAPLAVNESPEDESEGVALNTEVSVEFDQEVSEADLEDVEIRDSDDNPVEDVTAELTDNELIISHADFEHFTEYTVSIPEGSVENADEVGNEEFSWSFTTIRTVPVAFNESPEDESEGVALDTEISVEFDQEVSEADVEEVEIRDPDDNAVEGVSAELDENILSIDHSGLDHFTEYAVIIPEGTVENADEVGNEDFSWSFTTIRDVPLAINESPENESEGVALDTEISVEFDQEVSGADLEEVEIRDPDDNALEGVSATLEEDILTIAHPGLDHFTEYSVSIPEGTVENADEVGNEEFSWSFTTIRSTPLAINESPAGGSEGVALDTEISVEFDQEVSEADLEQIEIRDSDDNPVEDVTTELTDNELIISHTEFDHFIEYTVSIPEGTVENEDQVGNEEFSWSFTTIRTAPVAINENPIDGSEGIALDTEVSVEFDQEVSEGDLEQVEIRDSDDNAVEGVSATLEENVLTIDHGGLHHITEYTVSIPEGTVENADEVGNEAFSWSFTTTRAAPVVINESPVDGSVGIALDADVRIGFDQDVSEANLNSVEIRDSDDNPVEDVTAGLINNELIISHADFDHFTEYTVLIPEGIVENADEVGNEEFTWSFTTTRAAPVAINESPADGSEGVALDTEITVEFDQEVSEENLGQVEIRDEEDNMVEGVSAELQDNELVIDHGGLDNFMEYTVTIPEATVENADGVSNEEYNWSFTSTRTAPVAINESPADGSEGIELDAEVSVEFDQEVSVENLGQVEIRDSEDSAVEGVSATLEENVLTIDHNGLDHFTEYTVNIPEGTVENADEVSNEEFSWGFTTIRAAPLAINEFPSDNSEGIALDTEVSLEFDQDVTEANLNSVEIRDPDDNPVEDVTAELSDNELIISHADFEHFAEYTVVIPEGTVENADGVSNEEFSWSFTTIRSAPIAINESPADDSDRIALDAEVSVEFDQDVNELDFDQVVIQDSDGTEVGEVSAELDGNVLTLAHADFDNFTEYTVSIPEGTVENADGVGNEEFSWGFTTIRAAPVALNEAPSDGSEEVAPDAEVNVEFDQEVSERNLDQIEIRDEEDNEVSDVSAQLEDNVVTISHAEFEFHTGYSVIIPEGTVDNADEVGNEEFTWSFTTLRGPPVVESETPSDGAEGVSLDAVVSVEFDQRVSRGDIDQIEIRDSDGNQVDVRSVEIVGSVLIIAHADFEYLTEYEVSIPEGTVVNTHGYENEEYSWSFETLRFLSPPITENEFPSDSATGVPLDTEVSVRFNQDVSGIDLDQVVILDEDDNELEGILAELEDNELTITHPGFTHFTEYRVLIPEGTVENADDLVNEEFIWRFFTIREVPVAENESPADGSERVPLDSEVSVGFDQDVSEGDLNQVEIRDPDDNAVEGISASLEDDVLTIDHPGLDHFTEYTVIIPEGTVENEDEVGNEEFTWSFTTIRSEPIAINENPADGSERVSLDSEVSVEFDQEVSEGDLDQVEIRDPDDNAVEEVSASLEEDSLTIAHPGLDHFTEYTVVIPEGTVENEDEVGNEEFSWSFTTIRAEPLAINETPADGSDRVSLDTVVSVGFDQEVSEGDLDRVEIRDPDDNAVEEVSASLEEDSLTIAHPGLDHFTEYTVVIPEGTVENQDEVGNEEFMWSFTTIRAVPLAINEAPSDGLERVLLDTEVSVEFDQEVSEVDLDQVEFRDSEDNTVEGVSADLDENILTIEHSGLDHITEYTVSIPEGTVENADEIGNEEFTWSFTTIRDVPLAINESPADGSVGVSVDAEVSIEFDQEVSEENLDQVEIRDSEDNTIEGVSADLDENILTIEHSGLDHITEYTVSIPEGTVENADEIGNEEFTWTFTTIRAVPLAINETPSDGSDRISLDSEVSLGFDQDVSEGDLDQIEIQDRDVNAVEGVSATLEENELTIAHPGFDHFTEYTVIIPEGTVENADEVGNEEFTWSFTTIRSAPVAIDEIPQDGSERVSLDTEVSVGFDQDVSGNELNQVEIRDSDDNTVEGVTATLDENELTIDHSGLDHFTEYTVIIPEGTVENADEVSNEELTWSFTTIRSAPVAENETPTDGTDWVSLDTEVSVGFDQEVSIGDPDQVEVRDADNNEIEGVSADLEDNLLTISHPGFDYFTEYRVTIPEGTVENVDEVGNEAYSWSFTTIRGAPIAGDEFPEDGAEGISLDASVSVEFDQDVILGESDGVEIRDADENEVGGISVDLEDQTLQIEHDGFDFFTEYTVTVPSGTVVNEGGVGNESFSWSFTTLERMSAPLVESTSPGDEEEGVALDRDVRAEFNQDVNETDLSGVQIQDSQDNTLADVSVSLEDNELSISHSGFNPFTEYTVTIPEGAVENSDGVANEAHSWSFTSIREAPVAINLSPDDGSEEVSLEIDVSVEFDQEISASELEQIAIHDSDNNELDDVSAEVDESMLYIHHAGLEHLTEYVVSIPDGTVENADGVGNEEITWSFTTIIATPLSVNLSSPEDGADELELRPELVWEQSDLAETYHLQLTSDTDFASDPEIEVTALEDTVFVPEEDLGEDQTYRWRVRAENAGGFGEWSETRTFSTRPPPLVGQVILSDPVDSTGSISPDAELIWEPADGASHYNVEVATDADFDDPVLSANEVGATSMVASGLQYYTIYHWRVQGESEAGTGEWSEPGVFITLAESPGLQFPSDGAEQISIAPSLSWNSNYDSTWYEVRLGTDESFSQIHQNFDTEETSISVNGLSAGTEYYWQVRLADDLTTSEWSDTLSFTTREDPVEETVQVSINFQTESEGSIASEDFRLIGLPGGASIDLDEIFSGEYSDDWRAFTDTGEEEDYLEEYNPENPSFSFGSGRGYWVFNRESVDVEKEITPVELDEGDTYSISLNQGWNIIANPFNQQVQWEDITDLHEIEAPLYGYERVFESVASMEPLRGYYFYNDPDWELDTLQIPYGEAENRRSREQDSGSVDEQYRITSNPEAEQSAIRLLTEFYDKQNPEDRVHTGVELLYDQDFAETPFPSLEMAHYGVVLENPVDSSRIHQSINAEYESGGSEFGLRVKAPVGSKVKWQADFEEMQESARILLVNPVTRGTYMLADGDEVELSVTEPEVRYKLFAGSEAYLREVRDDQLPGEITLKPNYPNPFNPITTIRYALVEESRVNIEVYNLLGQRVATLVNEEQDAGWHSVQFDGSRLASGTYIYRLVADGQVKTGKMMLVK